MRAIDTLEHIVNNINLVNADLKYCLMDINKVPYTIKGTNARPNKIEDFVSLEELFNADLEKYAGLGISVQASHITAIDVDKCFTIPFDLTSIKSEAKNIINLFKDKAYVEFSFSGKGLRILFQQTEIKDYNKNYYIKNDKYGIEYYQSINAARYVSITGRYIYNNNIRSNKDISETINLFLNKYMKRKIILSKQNVTNDNEPIEKLMKKVKVLYLTNSEFQNLWFDNEHLGDDAHGTSESHKDFHLLSILYDKITKDKDKLKMIFESSLYFKTKDYKHKYKWEYQNFRYYDFQYSHLGVK